MKRHSYSDILAASSSFGPPTPSISITPEPWTADALCAQVDNELFYPEKGGSTREARSICNNCPARLECLEYAIRNREFEGIWGGTSPMERRRIWQGRKIERSAVA